MLKSEDDFEFLKHSINYTEKMVSTSRLYVFNDKELLNLMVQLDRISDSINDHLTLKKKSKSSKQRGRSERFGHLL